MSALLDLELIAGFSVLLIGSVIAFVVLTRRARAKNRFDRREHLKDRARRL